MKLDSSFTIELGFVISKVVGGIVSALLPRTVKAAFWGYFQDTSPPSVCLLVSININSSNGLCALQHSQSLALSRLSCSTIIKQHIIATALQQSSLLEEIQNRDKRIPRYVVSHNSLALSSITNIMSPFSTRLYIEPCDLFALQYPCQLLLSEGPREIKS